MMCYWGKGKKPVVIPSAIKPGFRIYRKELSKPSWTKLQVLLQSYLLGGCFPLHPAGNQPCSLPLGAVLGITLSRYALDPLEQEVCCFSISEGSFLLVKFVRIASQVPSGKCFASFLHGLLSLPSVLLRSLDPHDQKRPQKSLSLM